MAEVSCSVYMAMIVFMWQQMAEMYGELMELNDRLHRELAEKEAIVQRLSQQLQSRGISLSGVPASFKSTIARPSWANSIYQRVGQFSFSLATNNTNR